MGGKLIPMLFQFKNESFIKAERKSNKQRMTTHDNFKTGKKKTNYVW